MYCLQKFGIFIHSSIINFQTTSLLEAIFSRKEWNDSCCTARTSSSEHWFLKWWPNIIVTSKISLIHDSITITNNSQKHILKFIFLKWKSFENCFLTNIYIVIISILCLQLTLERESLEHTCRRLCCCRAIWHCVAASLLTMCRLKKIFIPKYIFWLKVLIPTCLLY